MILLVNGRGLIIDYLPSSIKHVGSSNVFFKQPRRLLSQCRYHHRMASTITSPIGHVERTTGEPRDPVSLVCNTA